MLAVRSIEANVKNVISEQSTGANLKEEITRLHSQGYTIANLEVQLENVQRSIDKLVLSLPNQPNEAISKSKSQLKKKKMLPLALSSASNWPHLLRSPCPPLSSSHQVMEPEIENKAPENGDIQS
ncbi:Kinesin-like protein NACK1 [Acorus calamus]|uniref:Kinesin-like protein NACK1 n=1 Tax=Acorus calamus TaxID=4465 RepID=A0AAV9DQ28_ACOCL|nr:Kinesin-like protein NACK1 [Acorus calamus]